MRYSCPTPKSTVTSMCALSGVDYEWRLQDPCYKRLRAEAKTVDETLDLTDETVEFSDEEELPWILDEDHHLLPWDEFHCPYHSFFCFEHFLTHGVFLHHPAVDDDQLAYTLASDHFKRELEGLRYHSEAFANTWQRAMHPRANMLILGFAFDVVVRHSAEYFRDLACTDRVTASAARVPVVGWLDLLHDHLLAEENTFSVTELSVVTKLLVVKPLLFSYDEHVFLRKRICAIKDNLCIRLSYTQIATSFLSMPDKLVLLAVEDLRPSYGGRDILHSAFGKCKALTSRVASNEWTRLYQLLGQDVYRIPHFSHVCRFNQ